MALVVDGLAGMGKTYLLRELVSAATAASGWQETFVRADEIERNEPYSFVERLIAGSRVSDWRFTPDASTTPIAVAREVMQRIEEAAPASAPYSLIVIDDAQWIDAQSQLVLRYLLPRIARRGFLVAFGARSPHPPGSFGEFLVQTATDDPHDEVHHVLPLTPADIRTLVLDRYGAGISAESAQRIHDATGGSFLGVDAVLAALTENEIAQLHLAWEPPIRLGAFGNELLLHGFRELSPEAQHTCELVCLAGHELTREQLNAAARALGEPVHLDAAVAAGVLSETGFGSTIMARHALLAQAVRDTVQQDRARAVSRALAATTTGHRSLRHTLRGAEAWSDELHESVNAYVAEATEQGALDSAAEVLRDALDVAEGSADREDLLVTLALIHIRAKNGYLMLDLLDDIEQLPPSMLHEFIAIVLSAHRVGQGLPLERAQRLLATPAQTPEERTILAFFSFMAVLLTMRTRDRARVPELIGLAKMLTAQSPADASELTDPRLAWMVSRDARLLVLDCYLTVQHQAASETELVREALPSLTARIDRLSDESLKVDALVAVAGARIAVGDLEGGRALAEQAVALLEHVEQPWAAGTARVILADCLVLQGEFAAAIEFMELAEQVSYSSLDVETRSTWAALRIIIAAATGQRDAIAHVEQARRQHTISWEGYAPDLAILAECELARANGDVEAVLAATSGDWVDRLVNTRHGFLTYRGHALIDSGRLDDAAILIEQLTAWRGERWHEYWGTLDWLRARLAQARGDDEAAKWHFEAAVATRSLALPTGLALADFGAFLVGSGAKAAGAEHLREAVRVLEGVGADGYLPRIRRTLGTDPAPRRSGGDAALLDGLTQREHQIVAHLAKGRSNNQIAESLVVSVTTVRSHVSNVLRKLQLSSRGEVVRLLRSKK